MLDTRLKVRVLKGLGMSKNKREKKKKQPWKALEMR